MKGIVLAGGKGTRLLPLTDPLAKEMLPVYNKPMIVHAIEVLVDGGIFEIALIVNQLTADLYRKMLDKFQPHELGCTLTYFIENDRRGPGWALLLAEEWVGKKDFAVILGDSLFFNALPRLFRQTAPRLFIMEMTPDEDDLEKYGQVKIAGRRVIEMQWKPKRVFSNLIQTTLFLFSSDIFSRVRGLNHLAEIHMSDLTMQYINERRMQYTVLPRGSYLDCGTIEALFQAGARIRSRLLR